MAEEKVNYQKILDNTLNELKGKNIRPKLLLHACCAPCSSYVIEYLTNYFDIDLLYYNPNISPIEEYDFRANELKRLVSEMSNLKNVNVIKADYDPKEFYSKVKGLEDVKEGGERCFICYRLRLEYTANYCKENGYDYFSTTLSISPLKNAQVLNSIGKELAEKYNLNYLFSDFKKRNGYRRSCELSQIYSLYRQNFCGCVFSKMQSEKQNNS